MMRIFSEVIFQSINSTYFSGCIDKLLLIIINSNCKITISKKNKLGQGIFFEQQPYQNQNKDHESYCGLEVRTLLFGSKVSNWRMYLGSIEIEILHFKFEDRFIWIRSNTIKESIINVFAVVAVKYLKINRDLGQTKGFLGLLYI